jgi:hypothetical protein
MTPKSRMAGLKAGTYPRKAAAFSEKNMPLNKGLGHFDVSTKHETAPVASETSR